MRLSLILGLSLLLLGIILDFAIYVSLPRCTPRAKKWRKIYAITAALTNALIIVVVAWPKRSADADILPAMWLLYLWISIYVSKIVYCLFLLLGLIPKLWHSRRVKLGLYAGLPLGVIIFGTMWYGAIWGCRQIEVTEVEIESPRIPAGFNGLRIVQFSDAHVGTWGNDTRFVKKLVDEINALKPDLIVFTGDIVNRRTSEIEPFISTLSQLHAPLGVYSIMGNHDYGDYTDWPSEAEHAENTRQLREIQKRMGWRLLEDEHVWLKNKGDSISLAGVENWGEPPFPSYGNFDKATAGLTGESFSILLSHNPMHWHKIVRYSPKVDLTLSGHTHAMQSRLKTPWGNYSLSALKYPEWEGLTEFTRPASGGKSDKDLSSGKSSLYVNIGCGQVGFPARIGATPELTLITLKKK